VTRYFATAAHLPDGIAADVTFEIEDGRFTAVRPDTAQGGARLLPGVVLPGFVNAHSHAFHRALRGRTHADGGTFWTWREAMYAIAARLDPDSYRALATAAYAEMALAGVTAVAEFHYLHHGPGGVPYAAPNAMRDALRAAASDAGIRLTLLDTCYLAGGFDTPLSGPQLRFGDRDVDAWAERTA
jgi:cytosine/adenosine deaminase-related metal-dependent hydrolase